MRRSTAVPAAVLSGALLATLAPAAQAAAAPSAALPAAPAAAAKETRDPLQWPYARTSIWNTPIGSKARYVPAGIRSKNFGLDIDWFVVTKKTDPKVDTYMPGNWGPGRCTGTAPQQQAPWHAAARRKQNVPKNFLVPDAVNSNGVFATPNNSSALLQPDGKTLVSYNVTTRCTKGGPLYGQWFGETSLFGDGIDGGHGGSGMSSIGGSIRTGELLGPGRIRHALKIDIWGDYLYYDKATGGKRWPARLADGGAPGQYKGKNKALRMGALLAVPPTVTAKSLGITSAVGRKLFTALRDYGAYVVDDSGWDFTYLCVEKKAAVEYKRRTGREIDQDKKLQAEFAKMVSAAKVVDNNGPKSIGGPGTRRAPLAPPFRKAGTPATTVTAKPTATAASRTAAAARATAKAATANRKAATPSAKAATPDGATSAAAAPATTSGGAAGTAQGAQLGAGGQALAGAQPGAQGSEQGAQASALPAELTAGRVDDAGPVRGSGFWAAVAGLGMLVLVAGGWFGRTLLAPAPARRTGRGSRDARVSRAGRRRG